MYEFRVATEKDFKGICNLFESQEELFLVHPNGKFPLTKVQVSELAQARKELTVVIKRNEIIGFANLYNYEPAKSAFIGNLIIDKNHRGKGLGKEFVSYMLKMALEKYNVPEVRISVFDKNTPALLLYSGIGFIPYEIVEKKSPKGDRVALIHMKIARNIQKRKKGI